MSEVRTGDTDVLILCGGLGTRFRDVRYDIPKALAPINGKPFIDFLLDDLVSQGFTRIILATGHLSNQIDQHVTQRDDAEYVISCEPEPLGTGGAIKFAEPYFRSDPVLVMNGDSRIVFDAFDLFKIYNEQKCDAVILLSQSTMGGDYGMVIMDTSGQICQFSEKPIKTLNATYVNAGVYLFSKTLIQTLSLNQSISLENSLMPYWLKNGTKIYGKVLNKPVIDIGTAERYKKLNDRAIYKTVISK